MLVFAAVVLFVLGFVINASGAVVGAFFCPLRLWGRGVACGAVHPAGVGTAGGGPRRRVRRR